MFREVPVFEVREVLRLWVRGEGLRSTERWPGGPQDGPPLRGRRRGGRPVGTAARVSSPTG